MALQELHALGDGTAGKSTIVRAVERVAKHLGNTAAVCRKCYIHPAIFEGYLDETLLHTLEVRTRALLKKNIEGISPEEAAVIAFLRVRIANLARQAEEPEAPPTCGGLGRALAYTSIRLLEQCATPGRRRCSTATSSGPGRSAMP